MKEVIWAGNAYNFQLNVRMPLFCIIAATACFINISMIGFNYSSYWI